MKFLFFFYLNQKTLFGCEFFFMEYNYKQTELSLFHQSEYLLLLLNIIYLNYLWKYFLLLLFIRPSQ